MGKKRAGLLPGYHPPHNPLGHHSDRAVMHLGKGHRHLVVDWQQQTLPGFYACLHAGATSRLCGTNCHVNPMYVVNPMCHLKRACHVHHMCHTNPMCHVKRMCHVNYMCRANSLFHTNPTFHVEPMSHANLMCHARPMCHVKPVC